jgi:hypothetical protein
MANENVEGSAARNLAGGGKYSGDHVRGLARDVLWNRIFNGPGKRNKEAKAGATGMTAEDWENLSIFKEKEHALGQDAANNDLGRAMMHLESVNANTPTGRALSASSYDRSKGAYSVRFTSNPTRSTGTGVAASQAEGRQTAGNKGTTGKGAKAGRAVGAVIGGAVTENPAGAAVGAKLGEKVGDAIEKKITGRKPRNTAASTTKPTTKTTTTPRTRTARPRPSDFSAPDTTTGPQFRDDPTEYVPRETTPLNRPAQVAAKGKTVK